MHMSVLVIGNSRDAERQLMPFSQEDPCYFEKVDVTEELEKMFESSKKKYTCSFQNFLKSLGYIKHGDANDEVDDNEEDISYYTEEDGKVCVTEVKNPNGKWDWIDDDGGGIYSDFFLLKNGTSTYSAKIEDIDFDSMCALDKKVGNYLPCAFIHEGVWYDKKDNLYYSKRFKELILSQEPNTVLTIVDCHY